MRGEEYNDNALSRIEEIFKNALTSTEYTGPRLSRIEQDAYGIDLDPVKDLLFDYNWYALYDSTGKRLLCREGRN